MQEEILKGFQVLERDGTEEDILAACKALFIHSDQYCNALSPFSDCEITAVARAIYDYIGNPDGCGQREIVFETPRPLEGSAMTCYVFAERFSQDLAYQSISSRFASLSLRELKDVLKRYFVAILFRYQFCIDSDSAALRLSLILNYMDGVRLLLAHEHREGAFCGALLTTLNALQSVELQ